MNSWEAFYGPNVGYALELYERYLQNPGSVDPATRAFFDHMGQLGDIPSATAALARPATKTARAPQPNGKVTASLRGQPAANVRGGPTTGAPATSVGPQSAKPSPRPPTSGEIHTIVAAARLARSIREYGHLDADIDPLGGKRPGDPMLDSRTHGIADADLAALPASIVWPAAGAEMGTCLDAIRRLRQMYCGTIGYEFDHVQDFEERSWLHAVVENGSFRSPLSIDQKRNLLRRLIEVDGLERFLDTIFQGQKRFSIEGTDALVPMLDQIVNDAGASGVGEVLIGMAHRGRLNVLAHILGRPYAAIFAGFRNAAKKEVDPPAEGDYEAQQGGGDVKYHKGARRDARQGVPAITLADNPSHLEYVNAVIQGFARAAQDERAHPGAPAQEMNRALAIEIHGDAAFPGEGVVAETLNISRLPGYETGGSVHIIVDNQVGFTTSAEAGRSTLYASDLAKGFEIPILHVNADDPEACLSAARLAWAYRNRFHKDFLIDLLGYRRWGHNEGDEPGFTQPRLYAQIANHPRPPQVYAERLESEGTVTANQVEALTSEVRNTLRAARDEESGRKPATIGPVYVPRPQDEKVRTAVPAEELRGINQALLSRPEDFASNPKLERLLSRRREAIDKPGNIDWALAETLALGSILADGVPIRLSGQDTQRGTFSQRHLVLHDSASGREYSPLQSLPPAKASFAVYNSPLTEAAVIGFEYGYSVHAPETLVLWEAQYGDFANAGQVLIDQFIMAARVKWHQSPALVLLLPHGYEGQGPEHSSARIERYLQVAANDNVRVVYPSTAAQYFHLLRLQAATLSGDRRPLIVMTPKSLLRRPEAASSLPDLAEGAFQPVIDDPSAGDRRDAVRRLVLCSGKVAIDLETTTRSEPVEWVAVVRVEQLYPFPSDALQHIVGGYPNVEEAVWVQEEPANMGPWTFVEPRLEQLLPDGVPLHYVGRPERASTAAGSPDVHDWEQAQIVAAAYAGEREPMIRIKGNDDVD